VQSYLLKNKTGLAMEERVPFMSERDCTTDAVDYYVNDDKSVGNERQHKKKRKQELCSGKKNSTPLRAQLQQINYELCGTPSKLTWPRRTGKQDLEYDSGQSSMSHPLLGTHARRFTPLFNFSTVTSPSSRCHFSLQIFSTKSVFGSMSTTPPRKFIRAFVKASTVSTSR